MFSTHTLNQVFLQKASGGLYPQAPLFRACSLSPKKLLVFQAKGVKIVRDIWEESDEGGKVRFATVQTYGDTTHTFVERSDFKKMFTQYSAKNVLFCTA